MVWPTSSQTNGHEFEHRVALSTSELVCAQQWDVFRLDDDDEYDFLISNVFCRKKSLTI